MAEETQEISSAPQESEITDDELWDKVVNEDSEPSGSDEVQPESVNEDVAEAETTEEESEVEEPQHDWEKRYKDLEKDYHKRNEDNASFRRETESKQSELERQLQALQIERLENKERLQKLSEIEQKEPETQNTLDALLSDTDKQTMKDFEEVMNVVNKIVDYRLGNQTNTQVPEVQQKLEEIEKAQQEIQYQRYLDFYDREMKTQVGDDYLDIAQNDQFNAFWQNEPTLRDAIENSQDPKRHAFVAQMWLNTDEGRAFRGSTQTQEATKASKKQEQKRQTAKSLAKNTVPPQEVDTSNMSEDELWEHIVSQEE